jgi:hypothetical protein
MYHIGGPAASAALDYPRSVLHLPEFGPILGQAVTHLQRLMIEQFGHGEGGLGRLDSSVLVHAYRPLRASRSASRPAPLIQSDKSFLAARQRLGLIERGDTFRLSAETEPYAVDDHDCHESAGREQQLKQELKTSRDNYAELFKQLQAKSTKLTKQTNAATKAKAALSNFKKAHGQRKCYPSALPAGRAMCRRKACVQYRQEHNDDDSDDDVIPCPLCPTAAEKRTRARVKKDADSLPSVRADLAQARCDLREQQQEVLQLTKKAALQDAELQTLKASLSALQSKQQVSNMERGGDLKAHATILTDFMDKFQKSSGSLSTTLASAWGPGAARAVPLQMQPKPTVELEAGSTARMFTVEDLKALGIIKP